MNQTREINIRLNLGFYFSKNKNLTSHECNLTSFLNLKILKAEPKLPNEEIKSEMLYMYITTIK